MKPLLIRADASPQIGTGHLLRCLALAQAWQSAGGEVLFATAPGAGKLLRRLRSEGMKVCSIAAQPGSPADARSTARLAHRIAAKWVVADGYHFDARYQDDLKQAGASLLFVDDNAHTDRYSADLVLNPNLHACEPMYRNREPYTRLLLGTRYALLRREFFRAARPREFPESATRLLVTLGGVDSANVTRKVIQAIALLNLPRVQTRVVVGALHPDRVSLQREIQRCAGEIQLRANHGNIADRMAWAHCAVAAAGVTSWELCYTGVPSLLIVVAENQRRTAEELARLEAAINLGWHEHVTPEIIARHLSEVLANGQLRARMATKAQKVVDRHGPDRIVNQMRGNILELRRAGPDDCRLLWEWANDRQVRAASFSSALIPWEEHVHWFSERLADPRCFLFVGLDPEGAPVGQVRLEVQPQGDAVIHVSIDPLRRGLGYGQRLISQCLEKVSPSAPIRLCHAYIKPENDSSRRAFQAVGFREAGSRQGSAEPALHYVKEMHANGNR